MVRDMAKPLYGNKRAVVEGVTPEIDSGRFPIKRVVGDMVAVEADVFGDGHDHVYARLLYRREGEEEWHSTSMSSLGNSRGRRRPSRDLAERPEETHCRRARCGGGVDSWSGASGTYSRTGRGHHRR